MRKLCALFAVTGLVFAAPLFACDKDKPATAKSGCHGPEVQTAAAKSSCHGEAGGMAAKVMEKLPAMSYRVGDFNTPCPHAATEKAGAEGKVQYVVDGKAYDCKGEATVALAALIEKEAADMMTVHYAVGGETFGCPMAAKDVAAKSQTPVTYRLAGINFKSQQEADGVAKLVSDAVAKMAQPEGDAPAAPVAAGGCDKAKAATASASGCCSKDKAAAVTASATGGCAKAKAATASAGGCCSKDKAAATGTPTCCEEAEKRLALAKAKFQVIVETVLASSAS